MKFDMRYRPDACAAKDELRPILACVLITQWNGHAIAVATDGFKLSVIPVELEDGDVAGVVHRSLFERARSLARKNGDATMKLGADRVTFSGGAYEPRLPFGQPAKEFPGWAKILTVALQRRGTAYPHVGFDVEYAHTIGKALGHHRLYFHRRVATGPILVGVNPLGKKPEPPFALLMPLNVPEWQPAAPRPMRKARAA